MKFFRTLIALFALSALLYAQETRDQKINAAQLLMLQAADLVKDDSPEIVRKGIPNLEKALAVFEEMKDETSRAYCSFLLGNAYKAVGDFRRAVEMFNAAAPGLRKDSPDMYVGLLMLRAGTYEELNEIQKAIDDYEEFLRLNKSFPPEVTGTINLRLGNFAALLEKHDQAIAYFNLALQHYKQTPNKKVIASIHKGIADSYMSLGQHEKALASYNDVLVVNRSGDDRLAETSTLNNICQVFARMGEHATAREFCRNALELAKKTGDGRAEAYAMMNLDEQSALPHAERIANLERVLSLVRKSNDPAAEADVLYYMARVYSAARDHSRALNYDEQALQLRRSVNSKDGEAACLAGIASTYANMRNFPAALKYTIEAITLQRANKNQLGEAMSLINLSGVYIKTHPRLTILLGKMSLNLSQGLRNSVRGLNSDIQRSYLRLMKPSYDVTIDLLLGEGRNSETIQILNLMRGQQEFDMVRSEERPQGKISFASREARLSDEYNRAVDNAVAIRDSINLFDRRFNAKTATPTEVAERQLLKIKLDSSHQDLIALIRRAEQDMVKTPDRESSVTTLPEVTAMQSMLSKMGAPSVGVAMVYVVLGKSRLTELVITSNQIQSVFSNTPGDAIDAKARSFVSAIKSIDGNGLPMIDVTDQAKELHELIIRPLATKLPKDTSLLMWSLDSNLRYLPIASLHDGRDFLVNKSLLHVVFTRSDQRVTPVVPVKAWKATVFANSGATRKLKNLNVEYDFPSLIGVNSEVGSIFKQRQTDRGPIQAEIYSDRGFTKDSFFQGLKRQNPVVHISSHFSLRPGDLGHSFLVLGDGNGLSLAEMSQRDKLFAGVELLTLSACETGLDEANAEGKEVDSFAELAQRGGAASVLASLWAVNDCSTAELMKDFYNNKVIKNVSKAAALRSAQLSLIAFNPRTAANPCARKNAAAGIADTPISSTLKPYRINPARPYEHPYYWSPFILFGDWR